MARPVGILIILQKVIIRSSTSNRQHLPADRERPPLTRMRDIRAKGKPLIGQVFGGGSGKLQAQLRNVIHWAYRA